MSNTTLKTPEPFMRDRLAEAAGAYCKATQSPDWDPTRYHPLEERTHGELLGTNIASVQRVFDPVGQTTRYNKNGGAKNHLASNMCVVHNLATGEECVADTQHNMAFRLYSFEQQKKELGWSQSQIDQHKYQVQVVYVKNDLEMMEFFESMNSSGIKPLSPEQVVPAKYFKGIAEEVAFVRVLQVTGRKLGSFQDWQPAPFGQKGGLAYNRKIVQKGKTLKACKIDPEWKNLLDAVERDPSNYADHAVIVKRMAIYKWLTEVVDVVPAFAAERKDSAQLIEGAVTLMLHPSMSVLTDKPQPWTAFVDFFKDTIAFDTLEKAHAEKSPAYIKYGEKALKDRRFFVNQEAFCYTGLRAAQKDGPSIAFQLIWNFVNSDIYKNKWPKGHKGLGKSALNDVRESVSADYFKHEFSKY